MKSEIKKLWVDALRSGNYPQAHDVMFRSQEAAEYNEDSQAGYCCLGVLASIYCEQTGKDFEDYAWNECINETPQGQEFFDWLGVEYNAHSSPNLSSGDKPYNPIVCKGEDIEHAFAADEIRIAALNDSRSYTFSQLADLIEEKL